MEEVDPREAVVRNPQVAVAIREEQAVQVALHEAVHRAAVGDLDSARMRQAIWS